LGPVLVPVLVPVLFKIKQYFETAVVVYEFGLRRSDFQKRIKRLNLKMFKMF
jgi:hypothetical protein